MQKLTAIIWKDFILRFNGLAEWVFFLILPVVFTVILAGGSGQGDSRAVLVVIDRAASPLSAELIAALGRAETMRVEVQPAAQAEDLFSNRDAAALLDIPVSLSSEQVQTGSVAIDLRLLPNNTDALIIQQNVITAVQQVSSVLRIAADSTAEAERIRPFASPAARAAYAEQALERANAELQHAPDRLAVVQAATVETVNYDPQANTSAGQLITWVFIPLLGISGGFVYERQIGTLRRLLVTPTRKGLYLFATIIGQVLMALMQMALLIGFGAFVMKVQWGNPLALTLLMVSAALAAAGIGTALGAFIKTPGQANGIAILSGMLMALLGGCWYPIELFPNVVQVASRVLPTRWAMDGILLLAVRGRGLDAVLPHITVLLGFAALSFAIGVWRFRYE